MTSGMKFFTAAASLFLATMAGVAVSHAAPCSSDTLDTYLGGSFSCTIGNETFSDFTYSTSPSGGAPASGVSVTPTGSPNWGFTFGDSWNAPPGTTLDISIGYAEAVTDGEALIDGASLAFTANSFGGTGTADINETICAEGGSCPLATLFVSTLGAASDTANFTPIAGADVTEDILLIGGSLGASVSTDTTTVSQSAATSEVPEPASLALFASGLIGLGMMRRRRRG